MMINAIKKDINVPVRRHDSMMRALSQIAYTHDRAAAEQFRTEVETEFPGYDIHIDPLSLSAAVSAPGSLALACCKKITVPFKHPKAKFPREKLLVCFKGAGSFHQQR